MDLVAAAFSALRVSLRAHVREWHRTLFSATILLLFVQTMAISFQLGANDRVGLGDGIAGASIRCRIEAQRSGMAQNNR